MGHAMGWLSVMPARRAISRIAASRVGKTQGSAATVRER